jgi:hypothetical protein
VTWTIDVPHDPDDLGQPLSEALAENLDDAVEDPESRRVAAQLFLIADRDGIATTGDLVDHVERLDGAGWRELLDRARQAAGLTPSAEIEAAKDFAAIQPRGHLRDEQGRSFQVCGEPSCRAYPLDTAGLPTAVDCRRWWCGRHQHLAQPGDDQPPQPRYAIGWDMSLHPLGEEAQRLADEQEQQREKARQRDAQRQAELEAIEGARERWEESAPPITVAGVKVRPGGVSRG